MFPSYHRPYIMAHGSLVRTSDGKCCCHRKIPHYCFSQIHTVVLYRIQIIIIIIIIMETVLENENFKLYWNRSVLTDKTLSFNRPDITFTNKKTKNTFLIDIAVPNTHNLAKTITDKRKKVPRTGE